MPTLVHDGKVVIESGVINEYLDEVFAEVPLRPADPLARAKMRVFCKMADEYALPAVRVPTWTRVKTAQMKAMQAPEFEQAMRDTPLVDHQLKYRALKGDGFTAKEIEVLRWPHGSCLRPLRNGARRWATPCGRALYARRHRHSAVPCRRSP